MAVTLRKALLLGAAALGILGANVAAEAAIIVAGSVGGAPVGAIKENFDALALGSAGGTTATGIGVSFTGSAAAVIGSQSTYAAPYLSGGNGTGFGPGGTDQANGPDATVYLASQPGGSVVLSMPDTLRYFGLLWGSIDGYNTLQFFNGGSLVGAFTGTDILSGANGDQGVNGTLYVNFSFTGADAFDRVVLLSSSAAFEADNLAFNRSNLIPEPASMALLGAGLLGLGLVRRRGRGAAAG